MMLEKKPMVPKPILQTCEEETPPCLKTLLRKH